jgi:sulfur carrier protein
VRRPAAWAPFPPAAMAADSAGAVPPSGPADPSEAGITIQVNGEPRRCAGGLALDQVLSSLGYRPQLVVVEFNGAILPRQRWAEQQVQESDCLEVVTIVGGGS